MSNAKDLVMIHGEYIGKRTLTANGCPDSDAYVAILKSLVDGHTEIKVIDNPEVPIYIAKPQFRSNTVKKELEEKSHLDMYRTPYKDIPTTIWKATNNTIGSGVGYGNRPAYRSAPSFIQPRKMLSNPYVYGADIDMGVHVKLAYNKVNGGRLPLDYNVGFFDIETDVNGTNQVILITFMNGDGTTYVGILKEFYLNHTVAEAQRLWEQKVEPELRSKLTDKAKKAYEKSGGIHINFQICDDEVTLIRWVFSKIHYHKPDFIGIWNMSYDIPYILKRLEFRGIDPKEIFCSPDVPWKYRFCKYKDDPGKPGGHLVDRWPWFCCTAYTRWIDSLMLYGRLRKAKPREPSYKLGDIGGKEIGTGKLEFGEGKGHSEMQRFHQVKYTVYNVVDVLLMWIMELKNHDVRSMMQLIGVSTLDCFAHQSIQLKNYFYDYLDKCGAVPASIGDRIDDPWDFLIKNKGGAVLDPSRASIAVPTLCEDDILLRGTRFTCDIDVSSMYPSLLAMLNCAKETKLATVLTIDNTKRRGKIPIDTEEAKSKIILSPDVCKGVKNYDVTEFFADAIYTEANAIEVGKRFNLPGFSEVDAFMAKNYPGITAHAA